MHDGLGLMAGAEAPSLHDWVDAGSIDKLDALLQTLHEHNAAWNWEVVMVPAGRPETLHIGGMMLAEESSTPGALIILARNRADLAALYGETLESLGLPVSAEVGAALERRSRADQAVLDELARVTSELAVSQRQLTKSNIELVRAYERLEAESEARLAAEKKAGALEKAAALGNFSAGVAHELNNLLVPVVGLSEYIHDQLDATDPRRNSLETIRIAAQRAAELIRAVMLSASDSRLGPGVEPIALGPLVAGFLARLQAEMPAAVSLSADIDPEVGEVRGEEAHLETLLDSLVSNAADALGPEGGEIRVSLAAVPVDAGDDSLAPGLHARLAVVDTGCGMDEETLRRAPDPFFTTKEVGQGTGLGLAVVRGIVTRHGGTLRLASSPGEGTRAEVYLPLVEKADGALS